MLYVLEDDVLGRLDRCACDRWLQVDCTEDCITEIVVVTSVTVLIVWMV